MGAGMVGILVLVIIVAVLIGLAYAGVGASLWQRRTSPDADLSQPDLMSPDATELRHDTEQEGEPTGPREEKSEPYPAETDRPGRHSH